jgi:uncharacterized RDD family membrane protein YckC
VGPAPPPVAPPPFTTPEGASAFQASSDVVREELPPIVPVEPAGVPPFVPPPPPSPSLASHSPDATNLMRFPRASFMDRIVAFALDAILVAIVNGVLVAGYFAFGRGPDNTYLLVLFVYHVAFWAWKGTTLGGIICNLRMVRTTGEHPRFIDALVRGLSAIFSVAALGIGVFWMISDSQRQMWHDKFAGTIVVKLPRELVLA